MKILSLSLLLLLAATVSHVRSSASVPGLIELLESNTIFGDEAELLEKEGLTISYPDCRSWHLVSLRLQNGVQRKEAYYYVKGLALKNDTYNVWIFDLDETLLSNVPFYAKYGYRTEKHNPETFKKWLVVGEAPGLPETLHLYQNIPEIGIRPVLLTERFQDLEEITLKNLKAAGFTYWRHVIFK
ncbi:unnamed protein product [Arabidopsis lyrata]|nr:unnamed protein product [Arabidopsis lyrata]